MTYKKPLQKLVSFTDSTADLDTITQDMKEGWKIISLVRNNNYYIAIMEQSPEKQEIDEDGNPVVFIPPRKKIKIMSTIGE